MKEVVRQKLYSAISIEREINELLDDVRAGTKRKCWNRSAHKNADASPSLNFDPKTGAWKCFACQEKGDIFTLYKKVRNKSFPEVVLHLIEKYRITELLSDMKPEKVGRASVIRDEFVIADVRMSAVAWLHNQEHADFMLTRYGLTKETLIRWGVGFDKRSRRVTIPVFQNKSLRKYQWDGIPDVVLAPIVNVRSHDCMRLHCGWRNTVTNFIYNTTPKELTSEMIARQETGDLEPFWSERTGKTLSLKGYGRCYLYPFEVVHLPSFYLVGGELKALLLNQMGLPALCFTTGEGGFDESLIPLFVGKRVRVIMDVDEAGVSATNSLSQLLADSGAYVQKGLWREEFIMQMPPKGDITDYFRIMDYQAEAIDFIEWVDVEPSVADEGSITNPATRRLVGEPDEEWSNMKPISFSDMLEPRNLRKWVRVPALVSGKSDTPYTVPRRIDVVCEEGRLRFQPRCASCPLMRNGFTLSTEYTTAAQLDLVGLPQEVLDKRILSNIGTPRNCPYPQVVPVSTSVEVLTITPAIELDQNSKEELGEFEYRHQQSYILDEGKISIKENQSYELGGRLMPDPKNGKFTFAIREVRPLENDILRFKMEHKKWEILKERMSEGTVADKINSIVSDLRENKVLIFGQDRMILTMILSMFLPFTFRIGQFYCERICPAVMILGDTTVGKSTAARKLITHYGAGRYSNIESDPTFAGLIGGNLQQGQNKMSFSWGLIPTSHRAYVVLDEYNKLQLDTIGKMTNTLSSGIAERTTASGRRQTLAWVRLLYLANPRGERPLRSYTNPLDAALGVAGTTQDLGRIEYVHIQHQVKNNKALFKSHKSNTEHWYTQDLARFHLCWAWNRDPKHFVFEDEQYLLSQAERLADKYGHHTLLIPAQVRFKLARFSIAVALLCMSGEVNAVLVKNEHVDYAFELFDTNYGPLIEQANRSATQVPLLPQRLIRIFDSMANYGQLKLFVMFDKWSQDDLMEVFRGGYKDFMDIAFYDQPRLIMKVGGYFKSAHPEWVDMVSSYIEERRKRVTDDDTREYKAGVLSSTIKHDDDDTKSMIESLERLQKKRKNYRVED